MSFDTDWDIDKYYDETEPEHHWMLRRKFLEEHQDKYPEDYLVALAKIFVNMEFMGCKYDPALMARVSALSEDIVKEYRRHRAKKIHRTLTSGSRAAESKVAKRPRKTL